MKKRKICRKQMRGRTIVITEAQVHLAFHEIALAECKKWMRRGNGNTSIRTHD
ncbi:MAG: hypothetical protein Q8R17_00445 [bacterium]|nr:hypothetical protein [bacterium]